MTSGHDDAGKSPNGEEPIAGSYPMAAQQGSLR